MNEPALSDWSTVTDEELWKACCDAEGYSADGGNCRGELKAIHKEMQYRLNKINERRNLCSMK